MSHYVDTAPVTRPHKTPQPVCLVCGQLECLCRPRFFAGQLLTEEDLNRLDHYIVQKHRLHNRYLHGWGVVCGLEVCCHPCEGMVSVTSGYALSPCGEDIVVCQNDTVDVCALIARCRDLERPPLECEPPRPVGAAECQDVLEQWVLAIRFTERPSRGVTALRGGGTPPCCSRCACGGSSACGCGCHERGVASRKMTTGLSARALSPDALRTFQRTARNQCEPTVLCESYAFEVYKAPAQDPDKESLGAMVERFEACVKGLFAVEPPLPDNRERWQDWCCQLKENWVDYFATHPLHECQALDQLRLATCPVPDPNQTAEQYRLAVLLRLAPILGEYLRSCLCSALLPPCPTPTDDSRVPLATITVRKRDCKIMRVCNLGPRKFLTTFPNLQYWFSFLPFVRQLRQLLEQACCRPLRVLEPGRFTPGVRQEKRFVAFRRTKMDVRPEQEFSRLVLSAVANRGRLIDAQTLFLGAMETMDEQGRPLLSDAELRNPLQYLLFNQIARPVVERARPEEGIGTLGLGQVLSNVTAGGSQLAEVQALREQVAALQRAVDELRARLPHD
jgi:hypothetical protein